MTGKLVTASICVVILATGAGCGTAFGQKYPERSFIREGNRQYDRAQYEQSETNYRQALENNPDSYEARYNLGNALYRQGKWEGAEAMFSRLTKTESSEVTDKDRFNTHFNAGNAYFQQRKLEEALEEYKQALRIDPSDAEAKYNLAYVKKLLEKDDNDGGGGGGGDDQNDDDDSGGNNDPGQDQSEDPDNDDNNKDDSPPDNNDRKDNSEGNNDPEEGEGNEDPRESGRDQNNNKNGMTREEAESLLDVVQGNEDKTREKMDEKKAAAVQRSEKNW